MEELKNKILENNSYQIKKINEERNIEKKIINDFFGFFYLFIII